VKTQARLLPTIEAVDVVSPVLANNSIAQLVAISTFAQAHQALADSATDPLEALLLSLRHHDCERHADAIVDRLSSASTVSFVLSWASARMSD
jgi:uncharacterized protein YpbB